MRRGVTRSVFLLALLAPASLLAAGSDLDLIGAAKRGDTAAVRALLKQGANVNAPSGDGTTVLHWSARRDDLAMADLLLAAGAKVNSPNDLGATPLFVACTNRSPAMVERLLKAGADPNIGVRGGGTPVMEASRTGSADVLKRLLDHGGDVNAKENSRGQTALMWAASEGHADTVRLLIERGADPSARTHGVQAPGASGTPAGAGGGRGGGRGGMGRGGPSNGSNGFTPLLFAARVGGLEAAELLLDAGADPNEHAADGLSALVLATVRGYIPVAMLLLERGADPDSQEAGYTALHWAAGSWESELSAVAITTERPGEFYTVTGLREGKAEFVKALVDYGADINLPMKKSPAKAGSSKNPDIPELKGATPLMLATIAGRTDIMKLLVAHGADPRVTTDGGANLVMAAAGLGRTLGEESDILVPERNTLAALKLAVEMGVNIRATDKAANTALDYAAIMRRNSVVQYLLDQGLDINAKNKYGETPLWLSELVLQFAAGGTFAIVPNSTGQILRERGAKRSEPVYTEYRPTDWPDTPIGGSANLRVRPDKTPDKTKPTAPGQPAPSSEPLR